MKALIRILIVTMLFTGSNACEKDKTQPDLIPAEIELPAKAGDILSGSNSFGIELFTKTAQSENKNMMLSPLSASIALTMLLNGSNADTYNQIRDMLGYPQELEIHEINEIYISLVTQLLTADNRVELSIANAAFYRQDFKVKNAFIQTLSNDFGALVQSLDFSSPSALNSINKWASDNTKGKIPEVLESIDPAHVLFLMNALYFKGDWTVQFDKSNTADLPFYLDDGSAIQVSAMRSDKLGAAYFKGDYFQALELPYGRANFSMIVMLPDNGLNSFIQNLTPIVWNEMTDALSSAAGWTKFSVTMPKFSFDYEKTLNSQLKMLGMTDAFSESLADLSGISDARIYVDFVKQNTFIDVNEEGTEAAAVTTVGVSLTSVGDETPVFVVDRPFAFAIRERTTNTLLFIGSVTDPR